MQANPDTFNPNAKVFQACDTAAFFYEKSKYGTVVSNQTGTWIPQEGMNIFAGIPSAAYNHKLWHEYMSVQKLSNFPSGAELCEATLVIVSDQFHWGMQHCQLYNTNFKTKQETMDVIAKLQPDEANRDANLIWRLISTCIASPAWFNDEQMKYFNSLAAQSKITARDFNQVALNMAHQPPIHELTELLGDFKVAGTTGTRPPCWFEKSNTRLHTLTTLLAHRPTTGGCNELVNPG